MNPKLVAVDTSQLSPALENSLCGSEKDAGRQCHKSEVGSCCWDVKRKPHLETHCAAVRRLWETVSQIHLVGILVRC